MKYLGLDLALTNTGWCVLGVKGGAAYVVRYGLIKGGKLRDVERIVYIENRIRLLCLAYDIQGVGMEGHAIYSRTGKAMDRAELSGVVKRYLRAVDLSPHIFPPATLKKIITGNGRADKELVSETVIGLAGLLFIKVPRGRVHDVADAYGAAYLALAKDGHIRIASWRSELLER